MAVTPNGVIIERFPEVLQGIIESQRENIDPDIENEQDEFLSEANQIIAERITSANEFLEAVRDCWDIDRAEGIALDNLLALKKVRRIPAARSSTNFQLFAGQNGTVIPAGRTLLNEATGDAFFTTGATTLTNTNCVGIELDIVGDFDTGDVFSIFLDGYTISYTVLSGDTALDIVIGLNAEAVFNVLPIETDINWFSGPSYASSAIARITTSGVFSGLGRALNVTYSTNLVPTAVWQYARIESQEFGGIIAPANRITIMQIPVNGLLGTQNVVSLNVGRLRETDEQFRIRGKETQAVSGVGTVPAILNSLLNNVTGVSSVIVVENDTGLEDGDGRPPNSFEVIVVGGDEEEIANDIYRTKPAGIQSWGDTSEMVIDSNGNPKQIFFTRPTPIEIDVRITYTLYDEEIFPVSGNAAIESIVVDYVNTLGLDTDVIPSRMFGPIYSGVSGIDSLVVEIDSGSGWSTARLPISQSEYATTDPTRVEVVAS